MSLFKSLKNILGDISSGEGPGSGNSSKISYADDWQLWLQTLEDSEWTGSLQFVNMAPSEYILWIDAGSAAVSRMGTNWRASMQGTHFAYSQRERVSVQAHVYLSSAEKNTAKVEIIVQAKANQAKPKTHDGDTSIRGVLENLRPGATPVFHARAYQQGVEQPFAMVINRSKPVSGFTNSAGYRIQRGAGHCMGKYYCGKFNWPCSCGRCDGSCGPSNGCNCAACAAFVPPFYHAAAVTPRMREITVTEVKGSGGGSSVNTAQDRRDSAEQRRDSGQEQRRDSAQEQRRDSSQEQRRDSSQEQRRDSAQEQRRDSAQERRDSAFGSPAVMFHSSSSNEIVSMNVPLTPASAASANAYAPLTPASAAAYVPLTPSAAVALDPAASVPKKHYFAQGYPTDIFLDANMLETLNLSCPICLDVVRDVVESPCGHLFCRACIEGVLKVKEECPMDSKPLVASALTASSYLQRVVLNMKVKCLHHDKTMKESDEEDDKEESKSGNEQEQKQPESSITSSSANNIPSATISHALQTTTIFTHSTTATNAVNVSVSSHSASSVPPPLLLSPCVLSNIIPSSEVLASEDSLPLASSSQRLPSSSSSAFLVPLSSALSNTSCAPKGVCSWTGDLRALVPHLQRDCPSEMIACEKCGKNLLRRFLQTHKEQKCMQRDVKCRLCSCIVTASAMSLHEKNLCQKRVVSCVNKQCKEKISFDFLKDHIALCEYTSVVCPFSKHNCLFVGTRAELSVHLSNPQSMQLHLSLLLMAVERPVPQQQQQAVVPAFVRGTGWQQRYRPGYEACVVVGGCKLASSVTPGLLVVVLNRRSLELHTEPRCFNTAREDTQDAELLSNMIAPLNFEHLVIVCSFETWERNFSEMGKAALIHCGASEKVMDRMSMNIHGRHPYVLVGIPGLSAGSGIELIYRAREFAPFADLQIDLVKSPLGDELYVPKGMRSYTSSFTSN